MDHLTDIYEDGEVVIAIEFDQHPENPRSMDNVSVLWCWHSNYELGEKKGRPSRPEDLEELKNELEEDPDHR